MNVGIIGNSDELIGFSNAIKNSHIVEENLFDFTKKNMPDVYITNEDNFSRPLFKVCKRNKIPLVIFTDNKESTKIQQAVTAKIDVRIYPISYSIGFDDVRFNPDANVKIDYYTNKSIWIPDCKNPFLYYINNVDEDDDNLLILSKKRIASHQYHGWPDDNRLQNIIYSAEKCYTWGYPKHPTYLYYLQIGCKGKGFTVTPEYIPTYRSIANNMGLL